MIGRRPASLWAERIAIHSSPLAAAILVAHPEQAAASSIDELLIANLIQADQADFARRIVAQQLHILLVSGAVPPN